MTKMVRQAHEHSYETEIIDPTCTESGCIIHICGCGDTYNDSYTAPVGHDYAAIDEKDATCTQDGYIRYECSRCHEVYTVITHAEHEYAISERTEATCTEDGYIKYECCKCHGSYFDETIPKGHSYESEVIKRATVDGKGLVRYTCVRCGHAHSMETPVIKHGINVLLIQDRLPWEENNDVLLLNRLTEAGYIAGWELVNSKQLAPEILLQHSVVMIANDQWSSTYDCLKEKSAMLASYVYSGGVLIYGACDNGWAAGEMDYELPGGVAKTNGYKLYNYIADFTSVIVTGALTDSKPLTDVLLQGRFCSHGSFAASSLPEGTHVIITDSEGSPTLIEYGYGDGTVIASGLTWELYLVRGFEGDTTYSKNAFDDLVVYAASITRFTEDYVDLHCISYDVDGGSATAPKEELQVEGGTFKLASYSGTKDGYTFGGWNDGENDYAAGTDYTVGDGDVFFTAIWNKVDVTGITLSFKTLAMYVNDVKVLTATVSPEDALVKTVTWSSDNTDVADVDGDGIVTAYKAGTAVITAVSDENESISASCTVTVSTVSVKSIALDQTKMTIVVGKTGKLIATVGPENASNQNVTWTTSKATVATVDEDGTVTAVSAGSAKITVTTVDGKRSAECTVTVINVPVDGIKLEAHNLDLAMNNTCTIGYEISPADAFDKAVTWTSSNSEVVSMDQDGNITAYDAETAKITVMTQDGGKKATCTKAVK